MHYVALYGLFIEYYLTCAVQELFGVHFQMFIPGFLHSFLHLTVPQRHNSID